MDDRRSMQEEDVEVVEDPEAHQAGFHLPWCPTCEGPVQAIGSLWIELRDQRPTSGRVTCLRCDTQVVIDRATRWIKVR